MKKAIISSHYPSDYPKPRKKTNRNTCKYAKSIGLNLTIKSYREPCPNKFLYHLIHFGNFFSGVTFEFSVLGTESCISNFITYVEEHYRIPGEHVIIRL